jgi:hypothetical protein
MIKVSLSIALYGQATAIAGAHRQTLMTIGPVAGQDLVAVLRYLMMQAKPGPCEAMLPCCLPHPLDSGFLACYLHGDDHEIKLAD